MIVRVVAAAILVVASAAPVNARAAPSVERGWSDEAIYFVMTDRFRNGDPSNDGDAVEGKPDWWQGGDLRGLIEKLAYIKALGMTALWITPVTAQTPGGYHGYWTLDFYAVDRHLGDLETLRELVQQAHATGLKVVLDVVVNHTGYGHPWLADPTKAGWFHEECGMSFSLQRSVEQCWLAGLPDLDTENPAVRAYLADWSLWLIRQTGVDGFRLDTARHVPKDFLREWTAAIKRAYPEFWILGEVASSDYAYQLPYLEAGLDAITDFQTHDSIRQGLGERGDLSRLTWPPALAANLLTGHEGARATFIDNHDVPRFVGRAEPDEVTKIRLEHALAYLFTMPGTPVLYYGTEVALRGGADPDNRRVMPWDETNADVRAFLTRVATLRRDTPALRRGTFAELASGQSELVYSRRLDGELAVVAFNGSDAPLDLRVPPSDVAGGTRLRATLPVADTTLAVEADGSLRIHLPARAVQVWVTGGGTGIDGATLAAAAALAGGLVLVAIVVVRSRLSRRS